MIEQESVTKRSQASFIGTAEWPSSDSHSLKSSRADSQLRRSNDFSSHSPCNVPCTQIGHPHFLCVRNVFGHDFICLRYKFNTQLHCHTPACIWNAKSV